MRLIIMVVRIRGRDKCVSTYFAAPLFGELADASCLRPAMSRVNSHLVGLALVLLLSGCVDLGDGRRGEASPPASADPCLNGISEPRVRVTLQRVRLMHGFFVGYFDITNVALDQSLLFGGRRRNGEFSISYLFVETQFRNRDGQWVDFNNLIQEVFDNERLKVAPHQKQTIGVELVSEIDANAAQATDFRVMIRPLVPSVCLVHYLRAVPEKLPIVGLEESPPP
jgi:hypothetical protein